MKYACLFFAFLISLSVNAQVVIEPNPSYTNSSEKPLLDEWLDVESLDGRTEPELVNNPSQKICFDKKMLVKARIPTGTGYCCIFINTKIGLVGYTGISKNMPGCELDVNDRNFNFNIIGLKGTHFNYMNSVRKGELRHHVITSNTHRQGLVFSAVATNEPLHRKDEQRAFFGKVKAWLYKANGRTESWWVFGKTLPDKLVAQPKKYLGLYGVGYQFAEQGMFIIMQLEGTGAYNYEAEILELQDIPTCFDATVFSVFEEEDLAQAQEDLNEVSGRIDQKIRENDASSGPCKALKDKSLKQQKKMTDVKNQQVQSMRQGRMNESMSAQVAFEIEQTQMMIDHAEEGLCKKTEQLARTDNQSSRQRIVQEKQCLNIQKSHYQELLAKFKRAQTEYRARPAQAIQAMVQIKRETRMPPCR